ncbi:MAG: tetratricopeptide repeat protein [Solidesulfovibrio sp. DCME]|uniref:tetratricopeptide repeat protein n=1 Tax=Solidesulfovibrio sp. DCME TaxID=3447380 RepID=UPI003D0C9174
MRANSHAPVMSRSAAILGIVLALLVGFFLGFTVHGLVGGKAAPTQASQPTAQMPPPSAAPEPNPALADRIKALEKQTQLEPANSAAWTELGNLYFDTHQPEQAIKAYEKSLTLDPRQPDVLTDQGVMYREIGQFDKALNAFDKALAITPGHVIASFNKSIVLTHDKNDKAGALAVLKALALKNPNAKLPDGHTVTEAIQELSGK